MSDTSSDPRTDRDARLLQLADQLPAVMWSVDRELRFTSSRGGGLAALGLAPDQVVGLSLFDYFGTRDENFAPLRAHVRALAGEQVKYETSWAGRWFETETGPLRDASGAIVGAVGMAVDVTERKQAEESRAALELKLRQQHRLEAVGQLGGGLAHEMNNPLQSILNFAQIIRTRAPNAQLKEHAEEIVQEVQRLASVVRNLQRLVQKSDELPVEVQLSHLVDASLSLFRAALDKESIAIEVAFPDDLPAAWCRVGGVQQALINLLCGARDALNDRFPRGAPAKRIWIEGKVLLGTGPARIRLSIGDAGTPIPADLLSRAFEPFTQLAGREQGAGIGLSISRAILRENGGELSIEADPEQRTWFHLDLPLAAQTP